MRQVEREREREEYATRLKLMDEVEIARTSLQTAKLIPTLFFFFFFIVVRYSARSMVVRFAKVFTIKKKNHKTAGSNTGVSQ
jgi:hypothetical protein